LFRVIADVDQVVELVDAGLLIIIYSMHILRFQVRAHILQYVVNNKGPRDSAFCYHETEETVQGRKEAKRMGLTELGRGG